MNQEELIWKLVKIGLVGTVISIPIGLWLIPKYKDSPWVPAAALTAVGYAVKHFMLEHPPKKDIAHAKR